MDFLSTFAPSSENSKVAQIRATYSSHSYTYNTIPRAVLPVQAHPIFTNPAFCEQGIILSAS